MRDYSKGKIYEIRCNTTQKVYIGSTIQTLKERLSGHLIAYKNYLNGKLKNNSKWKDICSSYDILENKNYTINLLENYPCQSQRELWLRERHYIENTPNIVNKAIPCRTKKERIQANPERYRLIQQRSDRKHMEKRREQRAQYRLENIDKIRQRQTTLITCECGVSFQKSNKCYHLKSQKHLHFIASNKTDS